MGNFLGGGGGLAGNSAVVDPSRQLNILFSQSELGQEGEVTIYCVFGKRGQHSKIDSVNIYVREVNKAWSDAENNLIPWNQLSQHEVVWTKGEDISSIKRCLCCKAMLPTVLTDGSTMQFRVDGVSLAKSQAVTSLTMKTEQTILTNDPASRLIWILCDVSDEIAYRSVTTCILRPVFGSNADFGGEGDQVSSLRIMRMAWEHSHFVQFLLSHRRIKHLEWGWTAELLSNLLSARREHLLQFLVPSPVLVDEAVAMGAESMTSSTSSSFQSAHSNHCGSCSYLDISMYLLVFLGQSKFLFQSTTDLSDTGKKESSSLKKSNPPVSAEIYNLIYSLFLYEDVILGSAIPRLHSATGELVTRKGLSLHEFQENAINNPLFFVLDWVWNFNEDLLVDLKRSELSEKLSVPVHRILRLVPLLSRLGMTQEPSCFSHNDHVVCEAIELDYETEIVSAAKHISEVVASHALTPLWQLPSGYCSAVLQALPRLRNLPVLLDGFSKLTLDEFSGLISDLFARLSTSYDWLDGKELVDDLHAMEKLIRWMNSKRSLFGVDTTLLEAEFVRVALTQASSNITDMRSAAVLLGTWYANIYNQDVSNDFRCRGWMDDVVSTVVTLVATSCSEFNEYIASDAGIRDAGIRDAGVRDAGIRDSALVDMPWLLQSTVGRNPFLHMRIALFNCFKFWSNMIQSFEWSQTHFIICRGSLHVKEKKTFSTTFKMVYFQLIGNALYQYNSEQDWRSRVPPNASYDIVGVDCLRDEPHVDAANKCLRFGLGLNTLGSTSRLKVYARTSSERDGWLRALRRSCLGWNFNVLYEATDANVVLEEWFEVQSFGITGWNSKPPMFTNKFGEVLPFPWPENPLGWVWMEAEDASKTAKHSDILKYLGPFAFIDVSYATTDSDGWVYARDLQSLSTIHVSDKGFGNYFRRRRWIRKRVRQSVASREYPCAISSYEDYSRHQNICVPVQWNLEKPPTAREVILLLAQRDLSNAVLQVNSMDRSALLACLLRLGDGEDWDIDIQRMFVEHLSELLLRGNFNMQVTARYLISRRSLTANTSPSYCSIYFSFLFVALSAEFHVIYGHLETSRPVKNVYSLCFPSLLLNLDREKFWSDFILWFFSQHKNFPKSWKPLSFEYLSGLIATEADVTVESECNELRRLLCDWEESVVESNESDAVSVCSQWWAKIDSLAFSLAKEFSFEIYCVLFGLRSQRRIHELTSSPNFPQLLRVWQILGMESLAGRPLLDLIHSEAKFADDQVVLVDTILRLISVFFPEDFNLVRSSVDLRENFESYSLQHLRVQLYSAPPDYIRTLSSKKIILNEFPVDLIPSLPWLGLFDDWRLSHAVQIVGASGVHAGLINGEYSIEDRSDALHSSFVCRKENGSIVSLQFSPGGTSWVISVKLETAVVVLACILDRDVDRSGSRATTWKENMAALHENPHLVSNPDLCILIRSKLIDAPDHRGGFDDAISIFFEIWGKTLENDPILKIEAASSSWREIYLSLQSGDIKARTLVALLRRLNSGSEFAVFSFLKMLSKTSNFVGRVPIAQNFEYQLSWVNEIFSKIVYFQRLHSLNTIIDLLVGSNKINDFLDSLLIDGCRSARARLWSRLNLLKCTLSQDLSLKDYVSIEFADIVLDNVATLDPSYLRIIAVGKELLEWLGSSETMQDDNEFQIQLERIRGKDQSMLPDEIGEDSLDRVLGEVAGLRDRFRGLLQRRNYDSVDSLLIALKVSNDSMRLDLQSLLTTVEGLSQITTAITELFEADDEVTIPNKLLTLSKLERQTRWVVSNESIHLETLSIKNQLNALSFDNILDFQSKLNLSQSRLNRNQSCDMWMDAFNQHFKWLRRLKEILFSLNLIGHPDYVTLCIPTSAQAAVAFDRGKALVELVAYQPEVFPLSESNEANETVPFPYSNIQLRCKEAEQELQNWTNHLEFLMKKHYFFNYFSINQIWCLLHCLQTLCDQRVDIVVKKTDKTASSEFIRTLLTLNGFPDVRIEYCLELWNSLRSEIGGSFDAMDQFGVWIDLILVQIPIRKRPIKHPLLNKINQDQFSSGVNIVLVPPEKNVQDICLSIYSKNRFMPERENNLFCVNTTSLAEAVGFIARWGSAHLQNRGDNIYCIINLERLSTDIQRILSLKIQGFLNDGARKKESLAKLVIVSSGPLRQSQYLCETFSNSVCPPYVELSEDILVEVWSAMAQSYGHQCRVFKSRLPGQGKTFQLNTAAAKMKAKVIRVPVHSIRSLTQLLTQVTSALTQTERFNQVILHVELGASRFAGVMSNLLFELIFMDGLVDYLSGSQIVTHSSIFQAVVFIEIANWKHNSDIFRICDFLPAVNCEINPSSFACDLNSLRNGFGELMGNSSFRQIRTVCNVLHYLQQHSRDLKFPLDFQSRLIDISGQKALELMDTYFVLGQSFSGHRIWCLVRMFCTQISDMFRPGSYIGEVAPYLEHFFVHQTLQFLALTAADICRPAVATERVGELMVVPWQDSNHEFMCLQQIGAIHLDGGGLSFLSMENGASHLVRFPNLREVLVRNNLLKTSSAQDNSIDEDFIQALNTIIGTNRTQAEAEGLLDGSYCITKDSVMKMIAIFTRLRNNIPVVLMGECGCGKTQLIRFTCEFWRVPLLTLDCHGGTSVEDIENIFDRAELELRSLDLYGDDIYEEREDEFVHMKKVFVFLDEINTCAHIGLISETITSHSLRGKALDSNIVVIGALNPYRLKEKKSVKIEGLEFIPSVSGSDGRNENVDESVGDSLPKELVYKVYPNPDSLLTYVFDFGALSSDTEILYITSMATKEFGGVDPECIQTLSQLILFAQTFIRETEGDSSTVSLRDVKRCLRLISWFKANKHSHPQLPKHLDKARDNRQFGLFLRSSVLGIAMVYYYRLGQRATRRSFWTGLCACALRAGWSLSVERAEAIIYSEEILYSEQISFGDGIAMNEALRENLFVTIVCISNRIPCILVGKPGSSKTLTIQIITSNLNGINSDNIFWRNFPAVTIFSYQCSPLSTAAGIEAQYRKAKAYQKSQNQVRDGEILRSGPNMNTTVLLLDEIGLAEHSPDLPLKVLHKILPEEIISIVGISNWVLDPAKMNRSILLNRLDPTPADLEFTGRAISNLNELSEGGKNQINSKLLNSLAVAYHQVYGFQKGRPFFGMRDYYGLLKFIRKAKRALDWNLLMEGLCRNFGGQKEFLDNVIQVFLDRWKSQSSWFSTSSGLSPVPRSSLSMIAANLIDNSARHLMVVTQNCVALSIMLGCGLFDRKKTEILIGSNFVDDNNEYSLVASINRVKECMARGKTVVLINQDKIFESLYDVLNMRTVGKKLKSGKIETMLRLAIGASSQLCPVDPRFKLVVIVEMFEAYNKLDVPLLSRFEKQLFTANEAVIAGMPIFDIATSLQDWLKLFQLESRLSPSEIIPGFYQGTVASLALVFANYSEKHAESVLTRNLHDIQPLVHCLAPFAVWNCKSLKGVCLDYFRSHGSLASIFGFRFSQMSEIQRKPLYLCPEIHLSSVRTWSSSATFWTSIDSIRAELAEVTDSWGGVHWHDAIQLSTVKSERELRDSLKNIFFSLSVQQPSIAVIQCDNLTTSPAVMRHARFICEELRLSRMEWSILDIPAAAIQQFLSSTGNTIDPDAQHFPVFPLHVYILLNDPPREDVTRSINGFVPLDFYGQWSEYFCDDIRPEVGKGLLKTFDLLSRSTYELASASPKNLEASILENFRVALSSVNHISADHPLLDKLNTVSHLFVDEPLFLEFAVNGVLAVLECRSSTGLDHRQKIRRMLSSLRTSLTLAYSEELVFALTIFFAIIDRNNNLNLLARDGSRQKRRFMFGIICSDVGALTPWACGLIKSGTSLCKVYSDRTVDSINDGINGNFVCRVPFSFSIIKFLCRDECRQTTMESIVVRDGVDQMSWLIAESSILRSRISLSFGDFFSIALAEQLDVQSDYLHDLVSISERNFPALSLEFVKTIYEIVLTRTHPLVFSSVEMIHCCLWQCENHIYALLGVFNALKEQMQSSRPDIASADVFCEELTTKLSLVLTALRSPPSNTQKLHCKQHLAILSEAVFVNLVNELLLRWTSNPDPLSRLLFSGLRTYIDILFADISQFGGLETKSRISNLHDSFRFLFILDCERNFSVLVESLFAPGGRAAIENLIRSIQQHGISSRAGVVNVLAIFAEALKKISDRDLRGPSTIVSKMKRFVAKFSSASPIVSKQENERSIEIAIILQQVLRQVLIQLLLPKLSISFDSLKLVSRDQRSNVKELIDFLLQICCGEIDAFGPKLGPHISTIQTFLKRSILQFLLSSANSRHLVEERIVFNLGNVEECAVCFELVQSVRTNCGHKFCQGCIVDWLSRSEECPICRTNPCSITERNDQTSNTPMFDMFVLMAQWYSDVNMVNIYNDDVNQDSLNGGIFAALKSHGVGPTFVYLANIQRILRNYATSLGARVGSGTILDPAVEFPRVLRSFEWARMFTLRVLLKEHGELILSGLCNQSLEGCPDWIPLQKLRGLYAIDNVPVLNPHILVRSYSDVERRFFQLLVGANSAALNEFFSTVSPTMRTSLLLLCVIRAAIMSYARIDRKGQVSAEIKFLQSWLRPPSSGRRLVRAFGQDDSYWKQNTSLSVQRLDKLEAYLILMFVHPAIQQPQLTPPLKIHPSSQTSDFIRLQVISHVVSCVLRHSSGWLYTVMFSPSDASTAYLPSMPEDEVQQILRGLDRSSNGAKQAYKCICGTLYFIGNCGQAWVTANCPECGRQLGGQSHQLVSTSRAVPEAELFQDSSQPGYLSSFTIGPASANIGRGLTTVTVRILRLIIHCCLYMSSGMASSKCLNDGKKELANILSASICNLVGLAGEVGRNILFVHRWLYERVFEDWSELCHHLGLTDDSFSLIFHSFLESSSVVFDSPLHCFSTKSQREEWELRLQAEVVEPLVSNSKLSSMALDLRHQLGRNERGIDRQGYDQELKRFQRDLTESEDELVGLGLMDEEQMLESLLWRYRVTISIEDFKQKFFLISSNSVQYPLIRILLDGEIQLSTIAALPSILQWHNILFSIFPDGSLTREQAQSITHADVIERLPESMRSQGRDVLNIFIQNFNNSFSHLDYIFECQANPYKNLVINDGTSIAFSLPSRPAVSGTEATEGICTVALAEYLAQKHNSLIEVLQNSGVGYSFSKSVPLTTQSTSPHLLTQQLCIFNSQQHLLPLLFAFSNQGINFGQGSDLTYDLDRIASALAELLVTGKQFIYLNLRLYQFMGEIKKSGHMAKLLAFLPQEEISPGIQSMLKAELQMHGDIGCFLRILETTVRFLASAGGGSDARRDLFVMPLSEFVLKTLQISESEWVKSSVPTARSNLVTLGSIHGLYTIVSQNLGVTAFSRVDAKYKVVMDGRQVHTLNLAISRGLDSALVAQSLRHLLEDSLSDNLTLNGKIPLKTLLSYVDGVELIVNFDELFPTEILVENALHTFDFLTAL